jgi:hypothetical protein
MDFIFLAMAALLFGTTFALAGFYQTMLVEQHGSKR